DDDEFNESEFEHHLSAVPGQLAECWYRIRKVQALFMSGAYSDAIEASDKAQRLLGLSKGFIETADYHFYSAMAKAACCGFPAPNPHRQHLEALAAHHEQLEIWAKRCPENFENRAALVGAEIARLQGRLLDAENLYEHAIASSRANGFVHNE